MTERLDVLMSDQCSLELSSLWRDACLPSLCGPPAFLYMQSHGEHGSTSMVPCDQRRTTRIALLQGTAAAYATVDTALSLAFLLVSPWSEQRDP
jgi:hypothetical protein